MLRRAFLAAPLWGAAHSWKRGMPDDFAASILRLMEAGSVPGVVAGTIANGKPGWVRALGVRNAETKEPVQPGSIFQAASLTKQAAAYAAFALRDQGKLDFDKPLVAYLDDLEDPQARTVTARHVLSHTTGFPNWRSRAGTRLIPAFAPGSQFQYSGEGYFYLQRVMEKVSRRPFAELMKALVFQPLGLTSTSVVWQSEWTARYAVPHDRRGRIVANWDKALLPRVAALPNHTIPNAASSMVTCAPDYAQFLCAAIRNPEIRKELIAIRPSLGWGLGWGIERTAGREYLWQWGDNGGVKNFVCVEPATGDGVFVFTNGDSGARVYDRIVVNATAHDHPALFWLGS